MFHKQRRSGFPLLIIALTLILAVVVVLLFSPTVGRQVRGDVALTITNTDYERNAAEVMRAFDRAREDGSLNAESTRAISSDVLALIVAPDYQGVHLELVIGLDQLARAYESGDTALVEAAHDRLERIRSQYPWLTN